MKKIFKDNDFCSYMARPNLTPFILKSKGGVAKCTRGYCMDGKVRRV